MTEPSVSLVERLRALVPVGVADDPKAALIREAADRIEELEKRGCCGVVSDEDPRLNIDASDTATVASEEK